LRSQKKYKVQAAGGGRPKKERSGKTQILFLYEGKGGGDGGSSTIRIAIIPELRPDPNSSETQKGKDPIHPIGRKSIRVE